ncbi:MAG TPA: hypothetical protein VK509_05105 [Polyangiales bacterium]|nr:hypothetical protein [Polyangiales bacterium]
MISEREHAQQEIERTTDALLDKAHELEHRVADTKDRIEQRVSDAKDRVERMVDPIEQVRDRPWRAVGAAVVLGFVIGWWS